MSKRKYKVGGYEVSYNTLQKILGSHRKKDELLNNIGKGKTVKATLEIKILDKYFDDGETSLGEEQAYRMYGIITKIEND